MIPERIIFVSRGITVFVFMLSTRCYSPTFMELEFSSEIFEKYSDVKIYEIPSIGNRADPWERRDRRTDIHAEANRGFSQFLRTRLKAPCFQKHWRLVIFYVFIYLFISPFLQISFHFIFVVSLSFLLSSLFRMMSALFTCARTPYCLYTGSLANQSYQLSQHNVQRSLH